MNTLYELTEDYRMFAELLSDEEADTESIQLACEALAGDIKTKADSYAKIIREMAGTAENIKAEEERLAKRRKALENRAGWLKKNLQDAMEAIGEKKIKTELFSFNIQKNPKTVSIADENAFIDWALVHQPTFIKYAKPSIDKTKVKAHLEAGNALELAMLTQSEGLRIR